MSVEPLRPDPARIARALLIVAGLGALTFALAYNEWWLGALDPSPPLRPDTVAAVRRIQVGAFVFGALLLVGARAVARRARWHAVASRAAVPRMLLVGIVLLPLVGAEIALRPFTPLERPMTTIFRRDPELGWTMRPGATGTWGDVVVSINADGLRGPLVAPVKAVAEQRILFLGDSVTFGYRLAEASAAFPAQVERLLAAAASHPVRAINAGVGGYSPWQARRWLAREGLAYEPDVVVLGFVLNDVTEKLGLVRFGGTGEGFQLEHSIFTPLDRLSVHSALFYQIRALERRVRYGRDVRAGAERRELLDVETLVRSPERDDVEDAWRLTLENVAGIARDCRERGIPFLLVAFPYAFQLESPATTDAPQRRLARFAAAEAVPFVDLLPALARRSAEEGVPPAAYFLDRNHLSRAGAAAVAEIVAAEIRAHGWLEVGPQRHTGDRPLR